MIEVHSPEWLRMVSSMLAEGFGVEDIARRSGTDVEAIRDEVSLLRLSGGLDVIYAEACLKTALEIQEKLGQPMPIQIEGEIL